jgi:hypothetical protein
MASIADSSVTIQTSSRSVPATPTWFGEVAFLVPHLRTQGGPRRHQRAGAFCSSSLRTL